MKTALVLGAGLGGLVAAETLRKRLPPEYRVIAVDRAERHFFPPSLLWLMVGERKAEDLTRPLERLSERGVELIHGNITRIDPARREAEIDGNTIAADALVIALGAEYAPQAVPGLAENGLDFYTLEGAQAVYEALSRFSGGRIAMLTATPAYKCPAAPYEAAMLVESFLKRRGIREKTTLELHAAEPQPMPVAGPVSGGRIRMMLERKGIGYFPGRQVSRVEAGLLHFNDGQTAAFDLLLYVPPHTAPAVVREAGMVNEAGWIPVDRHTLQTKFEGVFALGDSATIPLKIGKPLPKAGVFAHGQATVVAHNIAHAWTGKGRAAHFDGYGFCFVETGGGMAGVGSGNFYAEPTPDVRLHFPNPFWHLGKVIYEKYWLWRRF